MKKHPIKRLDSFKLGDWVMEDLGRKVIGVIEELRVNEETGFRYAYLRTTDYKRVITTIQYMEHLDPAIAKILSDSITKD